MNLRKSAKGQHCTLRLDGCDPGPQNETVVLCHINHPRRMGSRKDNWFAVFGCSHCHDIIDGRTHSSRMMPKDIEKSIRRALWETWVVWLEMGLITVSDLEENGTG